MNLFKFIFKMLFKFPNVTSILCIKPEFRSIAEQTGQPQCHNGRDGSSFPEDFIYRLPGYFQSIRRGNRFDLPCAKSRCVSLSAKVAITIPSDLLSLIDDIRSKRGVLRSKFITLLLRKKIMDEQAREIREAYDHVFSDESIVQEQLDTAACFTGSDKDESQEW